jgi:hypothetical protein
MIVFMVGSQFIVEAVVSMPLQEMGMRPFEDPCAVDGRDRPC